MFLCQGIPHPVHVSNVYLRGVKDTEYEFAVHLHVALILEGRKHCIEMGNNILIAWICLFNKQLVGQVGIPSLREP